MNVGVTDAAGFGLDHNLARTWCGDIPLAKHERLSKVFDYGCVHLLLCH
jgi:hypothetical protein